VVTNGVYELYFASFMNIIFNELRQQNKTYTPFYHILFFLLIYPLF